MVPVSLVLVAGCGSGGARHTHTSATVASLTTTPTQTAPPAPPRKPHKHSPPIGSLPQTGQLPSTTTSGFHQEMRALWKGVKHNSLAAAMPAFFPEPAYLQVKAIPDAAGDWRSRLVGGYQLDLAAAHGLLASGGTARLVRVSVPAAFVHWVTPGTCDNRVGYWEVPNSRVVYSQGGGLHSFGIASMISWRGIWYVVHLGAVERPGAGGVVDAPSSGVGVSVNSGTC